MRLMILATMLLVSTAQDSTRPKQTPEEAIRQLYKGMAPEKQEEQLKALRAVLPEKKDIELLFPRHAEKLWPALKEGIKEYEEGITDIAKEFQRHGIIEKVETIDIRTGEEAKRYRRVLEIIPKDIPAYNYVVHYKRGTVEGTAGGAATWLYVNNRWVFILGLDVVPEFIDKLK